MRNYLQFTKRISVSILLILLLTTFTGCGSGASLVSNWPAKAVQIDGNPDDWAGNLQAFPKEKYSVGFKNDENFLYVCFTTKDRNIIMSIMQKGLNAAFNSPKNSSKNYSVKFPLISPVYFNDTKKQFGDDAFATEGIDFLFKDAISKQSRFYLVQKEYLNEVMLRNNEGIDLKVGLASDSVICEIKVPLESFKCTFPVAALPGEELNVVISTDPSLQLIKQAAALPQNDSRGGRRGGGGGGSAPSGPVVFEEKFEAKFNIILAKPAK